MLYQAEMEHQRALVTALTAIHRKDRAASGDYLVHVLSQFSLAEIQSYHDHQMRTAQEKLREHGLMLIRTPEGIEWKWHSYTGRAENVTQALADLLVQLMGVVEAP